MLAELQILLFVMLSVAVQAGLSLFSLCAYLQL